MSCVFEKRHAVGLARIGEVVHESDGIVQGVESESCGQRFCDRIFYDTVNFFGKIKKSIDKQSLLM